MTKHLISENELKQILKVVQKDKTVLIPSEVSLITGFSQETCKKGLLELISRYKGQILYNQISGEVSFIFNLPLLRRKEKTYLEILSEIFVFISAIIDILFRSLLLILLLPVFILMSIMPILTLIAFLPVYLINMFKNRKSEEQSHKLNINFKKIFNDIYNFAIYHNSRRSIIFEKNEKGELFRRYIYKMAEDKDNITAESEEKRDVEIKDLNSYKEEFKKKKRYNEKRRISNIERLEKENNWSDEEYSDKIKSSRKLLIDILFDYTFGLPRALYSKSDLSKRALNIISGNNGYLTAGHLIKLEGYTLDEAREKLLDYVLIYEGELEISNDGILFAFFPNYSNLNIELQNDTIIYYGNEIEPVYLLTGNTKNESIRLFKFIYIPAIVSLLWIIAAIISGSDTSPDLIFIPEIIFYVFLENPESLIWFLFYYVIITTWLILLFPLLRLPFIKLGNKISIKKNERRKLFATIFSKIRKSMFIEYNHLELNSEIIIEESYANQIIQEIGGILNINESGKIVIDFKNLYGELNYKI